MYVTLPQLAALREVDWRVDLVLDSSTAKVSASVVYTACEHTDGCVVCVLGRGGGCTAIAHTRFALGKQPRGRAEHNYC